LRVRIESLASARCEYCRAPQNACGYHFHLEHIIPLALGGTDDESNRALACASCNLAKSNRTTGRDPETDVETALFHPRQQQWREHFQWTGNGQTLVGLTAIARATIVCLDMNNPLQQMARSYWLAAGLLPEPD